jgi:hypothetical protein
MRRSAKDASAAGAAKSDFFNEIRQQLPFRLMPKADIGRGSLAAMNDAARPPARFGSTRRALDLQTVAN